MSTWVWARRAALCIVIVLSAVLRAHGGVEEAIALGFKPPAVAIDLPTMPIDAAGTRPPIDGPDRRLLQAGPLPLPPPGACGVAALAAPLLATPGCQDSVMAGEASEVCCGALEGAVGPEAETDTRNCLCLEDVWGEVGKATDQLGIPIRKVLDECNGRLGARVPYFQGEGVGLCAGEAPPPSQPSTGAPLPLPDNPEQVCALTTLASPLLLAPGCQDSVMAGQATEVCCAALEAVVGTAAEADTRNCLCVEAVWAQVAMATDQLGIPIRKVLEDCNAELGADIAFYEGPGVGKCSGMKAVVASIQEEVTDIQMRNFREWISDLPEEPAVYASFIFAFPAAMGIALLIVISTQALLS